MVADVQHIFDVVLSLNHGGMTDAVVTIAATRESASATYGRELFCKSVVTLDIFGYFFYYSVKIAVATGNDVFVYGATFHHTECFCGVASIELERRVTDAVRYIVAARQKIRVLFLKTRQMGERFVYAIFQRVLNIKLTNAVLNFAT